MKQYILKQFNLFAIIVLAFTLSSCDLLQGNDDDVDSYAYSVSDTETRTTQLGTHMLMIDSNLENPDEHIFVRGEPGLQETIITIEKTGYGASETMAAERLHGIQITEDVNSITHRFIIDSAMPRGTKVKINVRMPQNNGLRVRQMTGRLEAYGVDGEIDVENWYGWVTIQSRSNNIRGFVDHGDVDLQLLRCSTTRKLDWRLDGVEPGDSKLKLRIPVYANVAGPGNLTASNDTGVINVNNLSLIDPVQTETSLSGLVDHAFGTFNVSVGNGALDLEGWSPNY